MMMIPASPGVESEGEAPPSAEEIFTAAAEPERKKRKYTRRKKAAEDEPELDFAITPEEAGDAVDGIFRVYGRMRHPILRPVWTLDNEEKQRFGVLFSKIGNRWTPAFLRRFKEEIAAGVAIYVAVTRRQAREREIIAIASNQNPNPGHGGDGQNAVHGPSIVS